MVRKVFVTAFFVVFLLPWQKALEAKERELVKCREKIQQMEGELQGSRTHHGNQGTAKAVKKVGIIIVILTKI